MKRRYERHVLKPKTGYQAEYFTGDRDTITDKYIYPSMKSLKQNLKNQEDYLGKMIHGRDYKVRKVKILR